jgi:glycolate oxidase
VAKSDAQDAREIKVLLDACSDHGASEVFDTDDEVEGEMFVAARRAVIPAVERYGRLLLEDVGVPVPSLPDLVAGVEAIAAERAVVIALIAHAGDGNTHPLIVIDPTDPDSERRATLAFGEIMDLAITLGGTITGEHGVGRLKRPWLGNQVGQDVLDVTRAIKDALDPLGILNPGTILDP